MDSDKDRPWGLLRVTLATVNILILGDGLECGLWDKPSLLANLEVARTLEFSKAFVQFNDKHV